MNSFEKVFTNIDLLTLIFNYLEFQDQLRLAQVNSELKYAFEVFSGNVNYMSLGIFQDWHTKVIFVTGDMGVNGKRLQNEHVLYDFLELYADRVHDLTLWRDFLCPTTLRRFVNLQSLTTYAYLKCYMNVGDTDGIGRRVKKNVANLEIVSDLCHWQKLESLELKDYWYPAANVCLQAYSNLKHLAIDLEDVESLKQLPLSNLKVLHLGLYRHKDELFSTLTESCSNLETLTLSYVNFEKLTILSLPPKMTELSLNKCKGLMHSCLKRILSEFKIIKFCSRGTRYEGEFHDFQISSHIQSLEIDFIEMAKFRSAYENNSQLKELIWYDEDLSSGETRDISFNRTPNLQRLDIPYISAVESLTQLNSLQSLKLRCSNSLIKWCDILDLLKHPTLHELSICNTSLNTNINFDPSVSPVILLQTNITRVIITADILETCMKFWLALFTTNMQMTLVCCIDFEEEELSLAKKLVEEENFPRKLKTMDLSCFTIDCEELRKNFVAVNNKYIPVLNRHEFWVFKPLQRARRIILSWKYEYNFKIPRTH